MTRTDLDHTRVVRAWLAVGSEELSPRVLDNVLREFPATNQDRPHWAAAWPQFSSFAFGTAVGAAVAVTVAIAMIGAGLWPGYQRGGTGATVTPSPTAVPSTASSTPSPTPNTIDYSYREIGYIGLPPIGATPSDPTLTELVETFWRPRHGGPYYQGAALLYADGRLIWNEYLPPDAAPPQRSTGWLEQTLTGAGIELVRALAIGDSAGARPRILDPAELPGQLPDDAWVDPTVRPYVPSGFAACVFVTEENPSTESNMTLQEMLAALPRAAAHLLRDRPRVLDSSGSYGTDPACLGLDVAGARLLDAALREAGFDGGPSRFMLVYETALDRSVAGNWSLSVWFEPILPDGTITCSGCG